jgi:hypothetical protein
LNESIVRPLDHISLGRTWNFENCLFRVNGSVKTPAIDGDKGDKRHADHGSHHEIETHEANANDSIPIAPNSFSQLPNEASIPSPTNSPNARKGRKFKKFRSPSKGQPKQDHHGLATGGSKDGDASVSNEPKAERIETDHNEEAKEGRAKVDEHAMFLFDPKFVTSMNLNVEFTSNCYYHHMVPPFSVKLLNSYVNTNQKGLNTTFKFDLQFPYDHLKKV